MLTNRFGGIARLTIVETFDSAGVKGLAKRLPDDNGRHQYQLRDPRAVPPGTRPVCRHVLRAAGDLQVSWVEERFATQVEIVEPGIAAYCFSTIRSGAMSLSLPTMPEDARGGATQGLIHQGQSGTRALTLDGTTRTNLWVSSSRIEAALAAVLGETPREPVVFRPEIYWEAAHGGSMRRLLAHAAAEFEKENGLATHPLALAGFTDLFVHTALSSLPHNYSERLSRLKTNPTPGHLRRAEAFMHAQAREPIQMADIATAGGCSVRTLQIAFRTFRDTTPHLALQRIRLDLAQADLLQGDDPVVTVARRFGFSNASRFSALYARQFGSRPRRRG